jgi:hypothetical protein
MLNPDVYFKCFFYIGLLVTLSLTQRPWPYLRTPWTTNCSERVFPRLVVCHFGSIALFCRLHIFLITYIMITALDASFYDAISYIWWKYTLWISSEIFFFAIHYHRFLNILTALFILLAIQTKLLAYHSAALLTNIWNTISDLIFLYVGLYSLCHDHNQSQTCSKKSC